MPLATKQHKYSDAVCRMSDFPSGESHRAEYDAPATLVSLSLARTPKIRDFRPESRLFRSAPRTCHGVGGRLRMRWTDCEGGSPRVRYTTARFRHPAWLRHGSDMAARGASAIGSTRYWLSE